MSGVEFKDQLESFLARPPLVTHAYLLVSNNTLSYHLSKILTKKLFREVIQIVAAILQIRASDILQVENRNLENWSYLSRIDHKQTTYRTLKSIDLWP